MKAILLSAAAGLLLFALITVCLRALKSRNRVQLLGILFLAVLPLLICIHLTTPPDLGFLSKDAMLPTSGLDLAFATFLYFTGFCGGILQLYNLAERGLSLRMLIDILEEPSGAITLDKMMKCYSRGQGIIWMYDKRLIDMISNGLVKFSDGNVILTGRGARLAHIYSALRTIAHIEDSDAQ